MSFTREGDFVTFHCDTCPATLAPVHGFSPAAARSRSLGWVAFKRVGYDWTHHCLACAPQAEREHAEYKKREAERARIRSQV